MLGGRDGICPVPHPGDGISLAAQTIRERLCDRFLVLDQQDAHAEIVTERADQHPALGDPFTKRNARFASASPALSSRRHSVGSIDQEPPP